MVDVDACHKAQISGQAGCSGSSFLFASYAVGRADVGRHLPNASWLRASTGDTGPLALPKSQQILYRSTPAPQSHNGRPQDLAGI